MIGEVGRNRNTTTITILLNHEVRIILVYIVSLMYNNKRKRCNTVCTIQWKV